MHGCVRRAFGHYITIVGSAHVLIIAITVFASMIKTAFATTQALVEIGYICKGTASEKNAQMIRLKSIKLVVYIYEDSNQN